MCCKKDNCNEAKAPIACNQLDDSVVYCPRPALCGYGVTEVFCMSQWNAEIQIGDPILECARGDCQTGKKAIEKRGPSLEEWECCDADFCNEKPRAKHNPDDIDDTVTPSTQLKTEKATKTTRAKRTGTTRRASSTTTDKERLDEGNTTWPKWKRTTTTATNAVWMAMPTLALVLAVARLD